MIVSFTQVALLVRDYDEAKAFYCDKLGFKVAEDTPLGQKRWVRLSAPGGGGAELVLHKASNAEQEALVGNQSGGSVIFFFQTNDFDTDYELFRSRGVEFTEAPRNEAYGKVVVFKDLYGSRIDLIEPTKT